MIRIFEQDDNTAVDLVGEKYNIKIDRRGANQKLWIEGESGELSDSYLIKFSTRKEGELSDFNLYTEVVCSDICEELGLAHVTYNLCQFVSRDGVVKNGVICKNYKTKNRHIEINGKTLHTNYITTYEDNHYGEEPNLPVNTVYTYIEELKGRFESRRMTMSEQTENRLTEELLTLALFDFCTCQIDRHWGNVGWIHNNIFEDDRLTIRLLPIYDNECCFLLDEQTKEKLAELISDIRNPRKVQKAIDIVNKKKYFSPYLGIRTPLVKIKDDQRGFLSPLPNGPSGMSNAEVAAAELAEEILKRPNMQAIYDNICKLDMQKLLQKADYISVEYDDIKDVYEFVWNTRVKLLKDAMEKLKNQGKGEIQDEAGLSSL